MAAPKPFAEQTTMFAPAAGRRDVGMLPVRLEGSRMVSCWELSMAEVEEIIETGVVWLACWGVQPPVLVSGHKAEVL